MGSGNVSPDAAKRSLGARVSLLIKIHLARGKVGVETVSGQLNMSRYTLHKKLRQEGVTFAALLEQVRREQAITYMKDKSKPLVEIAEQLGFSELSAFSRAFKRWMGTPPAEYRSLRMS
ncbi:MAG: helix-turn-helix transcriptional regulator [Gammaproteobacteria bacterium]|uniref:HTH-type transcriptional regulator VirS n=1 Tax=Marinobacter litoralis TaxID=187981 RepID=A0A3M2RGB8_9GAMM|nr:helix-turn-helix transcriptional regulator [Marinobacter litoralis]MBR9870442.1 helix-turn-helix transcriptional regulator [Gammaproteobacteria bacterium]RMJ04360.1 HTH-type transcriptional regulator VirS [Marinobacter litoralis]